MHTVDDGCRVCTHNVELVFRLTDVGNFNVGVFEFKLFQRATDAAESVDVAVDQYHSYIGFDVELRRLEVDEAQDSPTVGHSANHSAGDDDCCQPFAFALLRVDAEIFGVVSCDCQGVADEVALKVFFPVFAGSDYGGVDGVGFDYGEAFDF